MNGVLESPSSSERLVYMGCLDVIMELFLGITMSEMKNGETQGSAAKYMKVDETSVGM